MKSENFIKQRFIQFRKYLGVLKASIPLMRVTQLSLKAIWFSQLHWCINLINRLPKSSFLGGKALSVTHSLTFVLIFISKAKAFINSKCQNIDPPLSSVTVKWKMSPSILMRLPMLYRYKPDFKFRAHWWNKRSD